MTHLNLFTLYHLAIGTIIVGMAMTLWERHARPDHARELGIWAAGYATLAIGCGLAINRTALPGALGWAISNFIIVVGYLLVLLGVASLNGRRRYRRFAAVILATTALAWLVAGLNMPTLFWSHVSALPIALVCGTTAWELLRGTRFKAVRAHRIAAAVSGTHALFYAARTFLTPILSAIWGDRLLEVAAELTMYESVLYATALPMALLGLVREEAQLRLLVQSQMDYLTGVGNRQLFFERGGWTLRMLDDGRPATLLAFDLDHFKSVNDQHGHAAGDAVPRSFARIARETIGGEAVLARLGGEEFAALLPNCAAPDAARIGEAVARRFAATTAHDEGLCIRATVSIGLAERGVDGTDLSALLLAADRALYAAKARGRNRIEIARMVALENAA